MIIKKFQAKTEDEATRLAKAELGENVVILNVKNDVKPKGLFSFFKSKLVEVTVAREEDEENIQRQQTATIKETIASVDKLRQNSESNISDASKKTESPIASNKSEKKDDDINKKLDSIQSMLGEKLKKDEDIVRNLEKNDRALATKKEVEKKTIDEPVSKSSVSDPDNKKMLDFLKLLYNTMIDNEVSEKYANQMIDEISQTFDQDIQMEYILSHIYQKMILKFGKNECITPSEGKNPKVVFFIGPTGVGKTTTLAKLASMLTVMEHKKVALFTADTYRIAATDQLKTYATILETPFHIIYTTDDMMDNFDKYKDFDYILVDTAGHSHHNEEQKKAVGEFVHLLDNKAETEVYLVLSATTKYRDLITIADAYKEVTDYRLIFTKLDETQTYGNLLNLKIHTGASMSYVTCGQNVPDDIEKFSPQNTVKKLLGGVNE